MIDSLYQIVLNYSNNERIIDWVMQWLEPSASPDIVDENIPQILPPDYELKILNQQ